ncbi:MAG: caspase family protein [Rhizobiaceae bacterium]|nr:caspase family protein [Rhizobiaceae bacterium]
MASAFAAKRVALVIGNEAYETAPLSNPRIDAAIVEAALVQIGFEVTVLLDGTIDQLEAALASFAEGSARADVALFYFAGHGFAVSDRGGPRNFLMGVDADVTNASERALRAGGLPLDDVIVAMSEKAEATLIFVDACRNDPSLTRSTGGTGRSAVAIDPTIGQNVFVGLSTRLGSVARDGERGKGSPFARAFAANIVAPGERVDDVFTRVRLQVQSETKLAQRPDIARDDLSQPIILLPAANPVELSAVPIEGSAGPSEREKALLEELARLEAERVARLEEAVRQASLAAETQESSDINSAGLPGNGPTLASIRMNDELLSALGLPEESSCSGVGSLKSSVHRRVCTRYAGTSYSTCTGRLDSYAAALESACRSKAPWPPTEIHTGYVSADGKSESSDGMDADGKLAMKAKMDGWLVAAMGDHSMKSQCRVTDWHKREAANNICGKYTGHDADQCLARLDKIADEFLLACAGEAAWPPDTSRIDDLVMQ